jgi:hypothetical protein
MSGSDPVVLTVKLDGPLVSEHRLPLSELLRVGKQLRDSLRDVAVVLAHQGPSGTAGRAKKSIEAAVDLRVVGGAKRGSFVLELETPPESPGEQAELPVEMGPRLSRQAIVALIDGLDELHDGIEHLPIGFDRGVLRAIVPFRTTLSKGLTAINLSVEGPDTRKTTAITSERVDLVKRLIDSPFKAQATVEGVLQMVDFGSLECRVDRPPLPSVSVYFSEHERDKVHEAVRQVVRVSGEGEFEPGSDQPSKVWAAEIQVLYEALELDVDAFWEEKGIDQLAAEQHASRYQLPKDVDEDSWRDDDDAAALIATIRDVP